MFTWNRQTPPAIKIKNAGETYCVYEHIIVMCVVGKLRAAHEEEHLLESLLEQPYGAAEEEARK
jgi:hypothetical protein